jgi:hypothetical protein
MKITGGALRYCHHCYNYEFVLVNTSIRIKSMLNEQETLTLLNKSVGQTVFHRDTTLVNIQGGRASTYV